ncbi:MAG: DUF4421 family protein [Cyclobacteriaceae bacterium]|nr:DUF4421 family protein [Cyclobacteriaceae bacterium]
MKAALVVLLGLFPASLLAGDKEDSLRSRYVQRFPDKFFLWPVVKQRNLFFDISPKNDRAKVLNYRPNNSFGVGMGFYLFEVAVEVTTAIPLNEKSRITYGESDVRDLQANFLGKNWGGDVYNQNYKGFYVADPNKLVTTDEEYARRPDIEMVNTGINGIYIINHEKFSLRSAYNYSERQLKSGGSFVVTGTLNNLRLRSDSSILGSRYRDFFPDGGSFDEMRYTTFSLAPGYTFSLVYRSFFLNTSLAMGPAHHWVYYKPAGAPERYDITINTYADIRMALGYNSQRFFAGMSYITQSRDIRFDDIRFTSNSSVFKILAGYRFREVGILKKRAIDLVPVDITH